jgi:hypothetical protein
MTTATLNQSESGSGQQALKTGKNNSEERRPKLDYFPGLFTNYTVCTPGSCNPPKKVDVENWGAVKMRIFV